MDSWTKNYYSVLESKIGQITKSDFRFYNIGRLPLVAQKTKEFSADCDECRRNLFRLEEIAENLPEILNNQGRRTSFGNTKNGIESHLSKVHQVRPAHYFYALITLVGAVAGSLAGVLIGLLTGSGINLNLILIFIAAGLIIGQIIGKRTDRRRHQDKLQF